MARRSRTVEEPTGLGKITTAASEEPIKAHYRLLIKQWINTIRSRGGVRESPGRYNITGSLKVLDVEPALLMMHDELVLELNDGRKLGFGITRATPGSSHCPIVTRDGMTILDGIA